MVIALSQASAALRDLKSRVKVEAVPVSKLSNDDIYESEQAKKESLETIKLIKDMIRQSLKEHQNAKKSVLKQESQGLNFTVVQDPNQSFQDATQNNLKNVAKVADAMSGSIQNIINNFNSILGLTSIKQFSATLESIPTGYDAANVIHEIKPVLTSSGTLTGYTVRQTFQSPKQIKDFTAVDTGIVILADDSFLYNLIINPPKDDASPPTVTWNQSIAQGGVTNLSAASPGVILNLRNLTTYLKSQYVTTQTNLFPYINQIQDKQKIADGEGKAAVQHAQVMGRMLSTSLQAANQMVVNMTRQTSQINNSIANQLANIGQQITDLQATLSALETQEKALTAGIWAAISAFIVGLGM
ncbi:Alpha-amylase type A isozyme, partial [Colletotrichum asianum]